ncbi:hypothetical protein SYK_12580 [Pseudodesulfovibrio nedwellii]|uniref:Permuted papain-like amidase YaeF/Yiix C92 family enzyme n=1 Tax=Pseudodesulfovibrio nedwellii TaxID=2973072 RepID=A0ABM8AZE0_9BACT|nr:MULTISPECIES: hypothetical protein [Pseudodesulfovibrio]BDQ36898.1 hypothetical protein SYK_12580 [Pseudodesulfovibrio nedwellii]
MGLIQSTYAEVRELMKPGDVVAFSGKGHFSEIIKWATWAPVSHVGVILQTKVMADSTDRYFNQIIESTSLNGFNGVNVSRLSDRVNSYKGDIWWLPLESEMSVEAGEKFYDFLFDQAQKRICYDMPQAVKSAVDALDQLPFGLHGPGYNREDFSKFFCSELVAAGLEKAGVVGTVNASEVTPIDLCRWKIFKSEYHQIKVDKDLKSIKRYNSLDPAQWDV